MHSVPHFASAHSPVIPNFVRFAKVILVERLTMTVPHIPDSPKIARIVSGYMVTSLMAYGVKNTKNGFVEVGRVAVVAATCRPVQG